MFLCKSSFAASLSSPSSSHRCLMPCQLSQVKWIYNKMNTEREREIERVREIAEYPSGHGFNVKLGKWFTDGKWRHWNGVGAWLWWWVHRVLRFREWVVSEPELGRRRWGFHLHFEKEKKNWKLIKQFVIGNGVWC